MRYDVMNNIDEQAFPVEGGINNGEIAHSGMTLRDYFAAKIAQAYVTPDSMIWSKNTAKDTAKMAYLFADAMLEERLLK